MLAESLSVLKHNLFNEIWGTVSKLGDCENEVLRKLKEFWAVEVVSEVVECMLSNNMRSVLTHIVKRYGSNTINIDEREDIKIRLKESFAETFRKLQEQLQVIGISFTKHLTETLNQSVHRELILISDSYAQDVVDRSQADFATRHQHLVVEHTERLNHARSHQKASEQRIRDLLKKLDSYKRGENVEPNPIPTQSNNDLTASRFESEKARLREKGLLNQLTQLKQKQSDFVKKESELQSTITRLREEVLSLHSKYSLDIRRLQSKYDEEIEGLRKQNADAAEQFKKDRERSDLHLLSANADTQCAEDISHHLDVLCAKLNLETNWLLRVVRRAGIERERVEVIESNLQQLHYTSQTTIPLAVPGGWPQGSAPDTSAPITQRGGPSTMIASAPNVRPIGILRNQMDYLGSAIQLEVDRDASEEYKKLCESQQSEIKKLKQTLEKKQSEHHTYMRNLSETLTNQIAQLVAKNHTLQAQKFKNRSAGLSQRKFSTPALDQLTKQLQANRNELNSSKMNLWVARRMVVGLEEKLAQATSPSGQQGSSSVEPPPPPKVDTSEVINTDLWVTADAEVGQIASSQLSAARQVSPTPPPHPHPALRSRNRFPRSKPLKRPQTTRPVSTSSSADLEPEDAKKPSRSPTLNYVTLPLQCPESKQPDAKLDTWQQALQSILMDLRVSPASTKQKWKGSDHL